SDRLHGAHRRLRPPAWLARRRARVARGLGLRVRVPARDDEPPSFRQGRLCLPDADRAVQFHLIDADPRDREPRRRCEPVRPPDREGSARGRLGATPGGTRRTGARTTGEEEVGTTCGSAGLQAALPCALSPLALGAEIRGALSLYEVAYRRLADAARLARALVHVELLTKISRHAVRI